MHLRPIEQGELYDFARAHALAMWDDEAVTITAPRRSQYPDTFYRHCLNRTKIRWYRGELFFFAVTDEHDADWTGKEQIMGYCAYSTNKQGYEAPVRGGWLGNRFEQLAAAAWGHYSKIFRLDRSSDVAAMNYFRELSTIDKQPYFDGLPEDIRQRTGSQYWEVELLGTHPNFRRRGVGKMLLQWGFDRASQDQLPLVLIASLSGEKLYKRTGFQELARIEMDMGVKFGVSPDPRTFSWATMIWEPPLFREESKPPI